MRHDDQVIVEAARVDLIRGGSEVEVSRTWIAPHWGGVLAGLFVALATLILLSELGAAIGLSAMDREAGWAPYLGGASIWAAITLVAAFGLGGWLSASIAGRIRPMERPVLQGAMVWAVAVPLIGLIGGMFAMWAAQTAATSAVAAAHVAAETPEARERAREMVADADRPRTGAERAEDREETEQVAEDAAQAAGATAWVMVAGLVLSLLAAAGGGVLAAKRTLPFTPDARPSKA
jgi:hypothetical protein